ncbi:hypothetical protein Daus18300_013062 [Diaporthe australafricana]|uniref:Uncharacterized protein n=1 Tax=Diaporthe australafricana TaxID=127596 RepID=A0ABR3W0I5_9PEZI
MDEKKQKGAAARARGRPPAPPSSTASLTPAPAPAPAPASRANSLPRPGQVATPGTDKRARDRQPTSQCELKRRPIIISGFQCIGKSHLAKEESKNGLLELDRKCYKVIDEDSAVFDIKNGGIDEKTGRNAAVVRYVNRIEQRSKKVLAELAEHTGLIMLVSAHREVLLEFNHRHMAFVCVLPNSSAECKTEWLRRILSRPVHSEKEEAGRIGLRDATDKFWDKWTQPDEDIRGEAIYRLTRHRYLIDRLPELIQAWEGRRTDRTGQSALNMTGR